MAPPSSPQPSRRPITARQGQILAVIRRWIDEHGYPPTVREIGAAVGLGSPSSVAHHLAVMQRHGLLRRDARGPRAVDVRGSDDPRATTGPAVRIPVLGTIAPPERRSPPTSVSRTT